MRLILIDQWSGFVYADSADLDVDGDVTPHSVIDALHRSIGEPLSPYREASGNPAANASGYWVYRADIAVAVVTDGQDPGAISAVERDCACLGFWEKAA